MFTRVTRKCRLCRYTPGRALSLVMLGLLRISLSAIARDTFAENIEFTNQINSTCNSVQVEGDLLYLWGEAGLSIIDVSDLDSPVLLSQTPLIASAHIDVHVRGNLAYCSGEIVFENPFHRSVYVVEISIPSSPVVQARLYNVGWLRCLDGPIGYFADSRFDEVNIYDISNPQAPVLLSQYPNDWAGGIEVVGDLAYVPGRPTDLTVLDVSDPSAPQLIGSYDGSTGEYEGFFSLEVRGSFLYAMSNYGYELKILDISTPSDPRLCSRTSTPGDICVGACLVGDLLYMSYSGDFGGLQVYDVSDPCAPTLVGHYILPECPQTINQLCVRGDTAFYAAGEHGLYILRYTGPRMSARSSWRLYK